MAPCPTSGTPPEAVQRIELGELPPQGLREVVPVGHDASSLGGNSGSAVIDLDAGAPEPPDKEVEATWNL